MFPRAATCNKCGRLALIVAWVPMTKDRNEATGTDNFKTDEINCRVDCSICGTRIQRMEFRIKNRLTPVLQNVASLPPLRRRSAAALDKSALIRSSTY